MSKNLVCDKKENQILVLTDPLFFQPNSLMQRQKQLDFYHCICNKIEILFQMHLNNHFTALPEFFLSEPLTNFFVIRQFLGPGLSVSTDIFFLSWFPFMVADNSQDCREIKKIILILLYHFHSLTIMQFLFVSLHLK